ncbi:MAG: M1 family metallopeptidase [Bacteroidota bacterium]|nr:M1 family metallopeptidase [Bacteroidota bacterium]
MKKIVAVFCLLFLSFMSIAQPFTHADTLRGSNGPGRSWWDATKYDLHVVFNLADSTISGYNVISYKEIQKDHADYFQIDLQEPMIIDSIIIDNGIKSREREISGNKRVTYTDTRRNLGFTREGNAWFVSLKNIPEVNNNPAAPHSLRMGEPAVVPANRNTAPRKTNQPTLTIYYHGKPKIAKKAPWDGGLVWAKDKAGNPWVSVACQGLGASVWYPCKDIQSDEPDSAELQITAPSDLVAVSNGRLRNKTINNDGTTTVSWAVVNPINNYNLIPYMGKYVHFGEIYKGEKGALTMDYWVLDSNLAKAKKQFRDAPRMMKAFEYWFGPYPFYEDGYKLVDAPYLGMEHQSAVAYGNGYTNGYHGIDLSGSGWGMKWDFIIVHESGHEWFGNNITAKDIADNWIHEGFTSYSETLFTEYYYGKQAADEYVIGLRKNIENKVPIIAAYGVNKDGPIDIYYKASNMIHTIRQIINDDSLFRKILRGLNKTFYHQTVTTRQVEDYISQESKIDLSKIFDQYLRTTKIPVLEYSISNGQMTYRWANCIPGFNMPVKIMNEKGGYFFIYTKDSNQQLKTAIKALKVDQNFYIETNRVN